MPNATAIDLTPVPETARRSQLAGIPHDLIYASRLKRYFDLVLACLVLPVVLPLLGLIAVAIACDGGKPLYSHHRIGRDGRMFRMWKFRTMVADADALLAAHLRDDPLALTEWTTRQKLQHDPRVTRLGRWLRKSSLDELPQLWNVVRGDMSLVGPRPMMPDQRRLYSGTDYYAMRPGVTGLWQVSCRNGGAFADRAIYDSEYRRRMSFGADLRLMLATVRVVLRGTGQ